MLSIFFALWFFQEAKAFPEMVRHHYVNCNACHVSPSGGGVLNEYGRMISTEVLSTWGSEKEALFLHGLPNPEKWPKAVQLGGDIRAVQIHREDRSLREGRFIVMQSSLEGAITLGPVSLVGSFGRPGRDRRVHAEFTRFYLLTNLNESLQFRLGRFVPSFGLNMPHHTLPTRGALGFGYESERNTVEAHWNGEAWHGAFSASESRLSSQVAETERAISLQGEMFFQDSHRIGLSLWNGESEKQKRWLASLHGIMGFTEKLYVLSEFTWQSKKGKSAGGDREEGLFQFLRAGYEVSKGVHLLGVQELSKSDLAKSNTLFYSFGPGVLWYPRPHFELELSYAKRKNLQVRKDFEDYAYLMLHYYL